MNKILTDFYMWMQENDYDHNIRARVERKAEIYLNSINKTRMSEGKVEIEKIYLLIKDWFHSKTGVSLMHDPSLISLVNEIEELFLTHVSKSLHSSEAAYSEQFYCNCSRAKGLDYDDDGMPYCIECQKPVQ